MKYGMRKPGIKRSVKARTTSRIKRSVKKSINPLYGKKGMGWIKIPNVQHTIRFTKRQHLVYGIF